MKRKSLESVAVRKPKKKKGCIGTCLLHDGMFVVDIHKDGEYTGRYAMDLSTYEYGCFVNGKWNRKKFLWLLGHDPRYCTVSMAAKELQWDTPKDRDCADRLTEEKTKTDVGYAYMLDCHETAYIRERRERSLERKYEKIIKLMKRVPELPENIRTWLLKREEHYFFLDGEKKMLGCTSCGKNFPRKGRKETVHGKYISCPICGQTGMVKTRTHRVCSTGRLCILQNIDETMSVARHFKWEIQSEYGYRGCSIEEQVRLFLYRDDREYQIYYNQDGSRINWYTGLTVPEWYDTNPENKRMSACLLYPEGITEALEGTAYSSMTRAFEKMAEQEVVADYNAAMAVGVHISLGSVMEYLAKGAFWNLLEETTKKCDAYFGRYYGSLDLEGETIEEVFGIADRQKINRIRQENGTEQMVEWMRYEETSGRNISRDTLNWLIKERITPREIRRLAGNVAGKMSIEKIKNYVERQKVHYGTVRDTLEHWADYLDMMEAANQRLDEELFYKPKDLKKQHDQIVINRQKLEAVKRIKENPKQRQAEAANMREKFPEAEEILEEVREKYTYRGEEYIMLIPKDLVEIVEEGYALHHCAGSSERYFNRICNRETYIGFCRKIGEESIPYYTIEFEPGGTIRQNRSYYDEEPDIEQIRGFLKEWQKEVKRRLSKQDLEYARNSERLREQNLQELKEKNNRFVLAKLAEDFMEAV